MIPPLKEMRLRSIARWLNEPKSSPSAGPSSRAMELDDLMIENFEAMEEDLRAEMMRKGTWGTAEGMTEFPTRRLELWNQVLADYLPTTSDLDQET